MTEKSRIADDAALACTFIVMHQIRHAFPDEELQAVVEEIFEEIFESVKGAIHAAFAAEDEGG